MDDIDRPEHALALRLDASPHVDAAIEKQLLAVVRKLLDVGDEHLCLLVGNGPTGLNGVNQKHEFAEGEVTSLDGVFYGAALVGADVYVELAQRLDVGVDAFALRVYAVLVESLDDLRHRKPVLGVRFLLQDFQEVEDLYLCFAVICHGMHHLGRNLWHKSVRILPERISGCVSHPADNVRGIIRVK